MCPFLSYSTPEAATEATWRPFLAPVSSKASFLFKYGGRRGQTSADMLEYICCRICTWSGMQDRRSWVTGSSDSHDSEL